MTRVSIVFCLAFCLAGCDAIDQAQHSAQKQQTKNTLAPLAEWYHRHHDVHRQGPESWDGLFSFVEQSGGDPAPLRALQTDGYVVAWGYRFADIVIGISSFVLAYHPDTTTNGGTVLMMDGSTQQMAASSLSEALNQQSSIKPQPPPQSTEKEKPVNVGRQQLTNERIQPNIDPESMASVHPLVAARLKQLQSDDVQQQLLGLVGLVGGAGGEPNRVVAAALESFLNSADVRLRTQAVAALMDLGDQQSVPVLRAVAKGDPDRSVRSLASQAITEIQGR